MIDEVRQHLYNKSLIDKLTKIRIVVKNMVLVSNYKEDSKYLRYLMMRYAGKYVMYITDYKERGDKP